ncbi:hypothetical protein [Pedobacter sp. D749]|uniref:hypothetical protein n=1 Tax=Pedobacter sp. D749 TaxID=2856523 RepID=UPI001C56FB61|nr:hypothetical protein [Pedobacter sp. D749]QXU42139.1 hypothetical protein KYH19_00605 [Pedobacter sp. D749]
MNLKTVILVIALTIIIFIAYYLTVSKLITANLQGPFGDMFGGLTSFFSCLGFFGLVYTIYQQNALINQNTIQINNNKKEFDTEQKIKALTVLISIYESKYNELKKTDHLQANEFRVKVNTLTKELENFLIK